MLTRSGRPSSIDGIKRLAKQLKAKEGLQQARALDEAARVAGYANFAHARRAIADSRVQGRGNARPLQHPIRQEPNMPIEDFHARSRARWFEAIQSIAGHDTSPTVSWTGAGNIVRALLPIMGSNNNHTHLPSGGGLDMQRVRLALHEPGCLEFFPCDADDVVYLMKPKRLTLEFIDYAPAESLFHLELDELEQSDAYAKPDDDEDDGEVKTGRRKRLQEEVVEIAPRQYVSRAGWDEDRLPDGGPLPKGSRLVVRFFGGAAMPVAKGSLWNGAASTYEGRHSNMTPEHIRRVIENTLARRSDRS